MEMQALEVAAGPLTEGALQAHSAGHPQADARDDDSETHVSLASSQQPDANLSATTQAKNQAWARMMKSKPELKNQYANLFGAAKKEFKLKLLCTRDLKFETKSKSYSENFVDKVIQKAPWRTYPQLEHKEKDKDNALAIWNFCAAKDPTKSGKWFGTHPQSGASICKHLTLEELMELEKIHSLSTTQECAFEVNKIKFKGRWVS